MDDEDETVPGSSSGSREDDAIVREAKKRLRRCENWEATARERWIEDTKFANGDADNMYQWPDRIRNARQYGMDDERPCLTINKTRQHVLQIINDARQNRTHIKFRPVGGDATFEAAQIMDGIARHIEYVSNAQQAYATATRHQVIAGIGYIRVTTDYAGPDGLEQDIFIRRVKNPLSIYLDPDIEEADGSDARFGFVFEDMPKDEFKTKYPGHKDIGKVALENDYGWITKDHIRVAEYFRRKEVRDLLIVFDDPETGERKTLKRSDIPKRARKALLTELLANPDTKTRELISYEIEWFKIAGDRIIDRKPWLGIYIPIVRVVGEESVIDGEMDRKGHVRALKDPQRMYNYNASAQIEFGALQNKIPYIAPAEAIEGYASYWQDANTTNYSVLPYKSVSDDGKTIPPPVRQQPPAASQAYDLSMKNAATDMMLVSGQYQADFGAPSNERSGVAIQQRQRQGATATYHYIDHLAMAIRFVGKIVADLVPKVLDTQRVINIMAEDGSTSQVLLDPEAAQAFLEQQQEDADAAKQIIFNPKIGRYDVMADVGPDYATRRQEAFNALMQVAGSNQELMGVIGDLLFKSADFQYADEIARRMERLVPAAAKGEGRDANVLRLEGMLKETGLLVEALSAKLQEKEQALKAKGADLTRDAYDAETRRLSALKDYLGVDPEGLIALIRQAVAEAMASTPVPPMPNIGVPA